MSMKPSLLVLFCQLILGIAQAVEAGEAPGRASGSAMVDYLRDIKPLLSQRCYACHGSLKHQGGLRLDTAAHMRKGGDNGPAVVAGDSDQSVIIDAVTGREGWRMPPESEGAALSPDEIGRLKAWIEQGATAPIDERPQPDPRRHWSFQPIEKPEVITPGGGVGSHAAWVRNPIDAIVAVEHRKRGLTPRPAADPATLIRRLYLDLVGLIPSPAQVKAFEADPSDRAYAAIVDELLASPRYGERWGRHWMDVWRYSDWDGFAAEVRESQPHIWRWRDWIVESLKEDTPYDQMVVAMLAADENDPCDSSQLRATGFLVRNWYKFQRNVWIENTVEHTAKAFLGLTFNCAKCHDHKYDPILQSDYYAFRAFFEPHAVRTDPVPNQPNTSKDGLVRVFDADGVAPTYLFRRGDDKQPDKKRPLAPSLPQVLQAHAKLPPITPIDLPAGAYYPGLSPFVRDEAVAQAQRQVQARKAGLIHAERTLARAQSIADADRSEKAVAMAKTSLRAAEAELGSVKARIAADTARFARPSQPGAANLARAASRLERVRNLLRAQEEVQLAEHALADARDTKSKTDGSTRLTAARKAAESAHKALADDNASYTTLTPVYAPTSTGRRLALARWIVHPANPLTARVAVNQIWMRHTGTPLVPTVFDFGSNGTPPALPGLLDWLAAHLRDGGWRMKPIHRLIVTSALYRMQSTASGRDDPNLTRDPANLYYWRMNPRRMEAEIVRDNLLAVAGNLDQTMGGPDLDPESGQNLTRRSLYFRHAKEKRLTFLRLFDSPNVLACYRRSESVAPQQALALANSALCREQARILAQHLAQSATSASADPGTFITTVFETILGRQPTAAERAFCTAFLDKQANRLASKATLTPFAPGPVNNAVAAAGEPASRAREDLVHVILNHNDFVTIR